MVIVNVVLVSFSSLFLALFALFFKQMSILLDAENMWFEMQCVDNESEMDFSSVLE